MRKLDKIILHCADTRTDQDFSVDDVRHWHKARGWSDIGYHYYIKCNGSLHAKGHNANSIGICFEGGKNSDNEIWDEPTNKQIRTVKKLIKSLRKDYGELTVHGHYEFSSKGCPNFDVCILNLD